MADRKPSTTPKSRGRDVPPLKAVRTRAIRAPRPIDDQTLLEILTRFEEADPNPRGELDYHDPYTLLVAVVLSAQATDKSVNLATRELFKAAGTPAQMVALGEERLSEYIRTIGLFRTKARNVVALSRILLETHGGVVPPTREVLETLPGVGRKTASVVMNVAFAQPTIAVDTHVFRVSHRIPIVIAKTPDDVQIGLEKRIPQRFVARAHHWLILHGRYTCKARTPDCPRCLIRDLCRFPSKTIA
jgi:endonuclease-3